MKFYLEPVIAICAKYTVLPSIIQTPLIIYNDDQYYKQIQFIQKLSQIQNLTHNQKNYTIGSQSSFSSNIAYVK